MHTKFSGKQGPDIEDIFQGEHKHYQFNIVISGKERCLIFRSLHPDILLTLFR